jgi:hypothetical protein
MARVFALPSRYGAEAWQKIAKAVGTSVAPPSAPTAAPDPKPRPPAAAAARRPPLEDLMADLTRMKDEATKKDAPSSGPVFCPAYDWHKALDLAQDGSPSAGARRVQLPVLFTGKATTSARQYNARDPRADPREPRRARRQGHRGGRRRRTLVERHQHLPGRPVAGNDWEGYQFTRAASRTTRSRSSWRCW